MGQNWGTGRSGTRIRWTIWPWLCILAAALTVEGAQAQVPGPEESAPRADYLIENPLLRKFFKLQYVGSQASREIPDSEFIENFIDSQIRSFGTKVEQELDEVIATSAAIAQMRVRWIEGQGEAERRRAARALPVMLRRLADQSDDLADLLQAVFPDLKRGRKLRIGIEKSDEADGYIRQIEFIQTQIAKAEQLIRNYLFRSGQTIHLEDLKADNMLTRLDSVESMAKRLADELS